MACMCGGCADCLSAQPGDSSCPECGESFLGDKYAGEVCSVCEEELYGKPDRESLYQSLEGSPETVVYIATSVEELVTSVCFKFKTGLGRLI